MNLCKNCVHYKFFKCTNEHNKQINPVNGKTLLKLTPFQLRTTDQINTCGPKGSWFKSK